jgi:nucleotide-binding universal stress UspA family protein
MKTYLLPIDFSDAAYNTATYVAELSHHTDVTDIILMNAYYISPYETMLPDANMFLMREEEVEQNAAERISQLEELKQKMIREVRSNVRLRIRLNRSHLIRAVVDCVEEDDIDVVIIGAKGNSSAGQEGIGSHVVGISKACPVPVLVVPPSYKFEPVDTAVIACDFKHITENLPVGMLHRVLGKQQINLLVVNVDPQGRTPETHPELLAEKTALHNLLKVYNPKYHYIHTENVIKGILDFATLKGAQVVIALPHRYSFLQSILHSSISRQLASAAQVPVLLLK